MLKTDKLYQFLQQITPALTKTDLELFVSKARPKNIQKEELFLREGAVCRHLLFIERGLLRYFLLHEGLDITKDFAVDTQNPFCTSYTSFMLMRPSEIWIEALEPSQVLVWERSDVIPLFEEHPAWQRFAKIMSDRLFFRKERREIELLKSTAEERYLSFLKDFPGLSQRVPQYHIASYLGITPESLSRLRSKLAKRS
jgi:CRP/FNR family transcriptional regulator, anaerobic regulatory protein